MFSWCEWGISLEQSRSQFALWAIMAAVSFNFFFFFWLSVLELVGKILEFDLHLNFNQMLYYFAVSN